MKQLPATLLVILILLPGLTEKTIAAESTSLNPFTVVYNFSNSGISMVRMTRTLTQHEDGHYQLTSRSRAVDFFAWFIKDRISETSQWQFINGQPRPNHYQYRRTGKRERHVELDFDWQRGRVTNTINNDPWQMDIPPQTLDKLLYQLSLMLDLKAGRKTLDYTVADGGKLKQFHFNLLGQEQLELPLGRFDTLKLKHNSHKRSTTIWCAPSLDYLPVRIKHIGKDDHEILMEAISVEGLPFKIETIAKIKK